jgi:NitT/TauT family transport system substrate-binding protein
MWRRRGLLGAGLTMLGLGLPGAWAQERAFAGRLVIAVGPKSDLGYLPLTVAERNGFFAAEGVDVEVREVASAQEAMRAVRSGHAHVCSGPYSEVVRQQVVGQSHAAFVLQGRTPQMVLGVSQRTMSPYQGVHELKGRRIGVMGMGSTSHRMAQVLLARAGIRTAQQTSFVELATPLDAVSAFYAGEIDAICYNEPTVTLLEQSGALRVVADTRTVRGCTEVFGDLMPSGCLSAPQAFLAAQPRTGQALANAVVHGLKWLQTAGPSDIIKTVPERYFQGDRALYLAAFSRAREAWSPDGVMPVSGPAMVAGMLAQFDGSGAFERVELVKTYTNEFAKKAKARFKA